MGNCVFEETASLQSLGCFLHFRVDENICRNGSCSWKDNAPVWTGSYKPGNPNPRIRTEENFWTRGETSPTNKRSVESKL